MRKGFTLIELIVVIAIIAVLAAIVAPSAFKAIEKGKASATIGDLKSIKTAAMAYYADTGLWPANITNSSGIGFVTDDSVGGWDGPYLEKWPAKAQWGTGNYSYYATTTTRYVAVSNIPSSSVLKLDTQVDGSVNATQGTILYTNGTGNLVMNYTIS